MSMIFFRGRNGVAYCLDLSRGELRRGDHTIHIPPRAWRLAVYLAHRPGELVSKNDLVENVWEGTNVSDDTLSGTVHKLRDALGDDPTIP
jgi:DNA-binding winged helix-turn-helix (wHTH) protein